MACLTAQGTKGRFILLKHSCFLSTETDHLKSLFLHKDLGNFFLLAQNEGFKPVAVGPLLQHAPETLFVVI